MLAQPAKMSAAKGALAKVKRREKEVLKDVVMMFLSKKNGMQDLRALCDRATAA
jgi:hypothetical protein